MHYRSGTMLMAGRNITSTSDKLQKVRLDYLYHSIRNPKPEIATLVRLLQTVRDIDRVRYAHMKRQLPYFVCASFNPPYLLAENFSCIEHFMVEVGGLNAKGIDADELKGHLATDRQVQLMFLSPGGDSLKIMFSLKEKCYDAGLFAVFYNLFYKSFLERHGIDVDFSASEGAVTDACYISVDEKAYFNASAEAVDLCSYVSEDNPSLLFDTLREMRHAAKEAKKQCLPDDESEACADPDADALLHIKEVLLGAKAVETDRKPIKDKEEFDSIIAGLRGFVEDNGVNLVEERSMLHARKLRFNLDGNVAEVNVFRGTKGYFAVQSPVGTSSQKIGKVVLEIVNAYLSGI